ncbi:hypothetical protein CEXT_52081 [Caerostris extrusa]|uniref:Uncharacterized protein n=1 Tax=Caerostris extrusa TaxID=172846 RepID=A0AAV4N6J6_CAEEX|nr:hypothetical protein CEXT_52081 [Caerostris extrusa]
MNMDLSRLRHHPLSMRHNTASNSSRRKRSSATEKRYDSALGFVNVANIICDQDLLDKMSTAKLTKLPSSRRRRRNIKQLYKGNGFDQLTVDETGDGGQVFPPEPKMPPIMVRNCGNLKTVVADIGNNFENKNKNQARGILGPQRLSSKGVPTGYNEGEEVLEALTQAGYKIERKRLDQPKCVVTRNEIGHLAAWRGCPKFPKTEDAAEAAGVARRGFHGKKSNPRGVLCCQYGARSSTNSIAGPYYGNQHNHQIVQNQVPNSNFDCSYN